MKNLVLVGFMGSGKTEVGKVAADRLRMSFVDMDDEIERREEKKISEIFAQDGESYFRQLERGLTTELANQQGLVIASGGGIVLDVRNVADFKKNGVIVGLGVHVDTALQRVGHQTHRPLLEGHDPPKDGLALPRRASVASKRGQVEKLLKIRAPLYRNAGTYIETDKQTIEEVVAAVVAAYQKNM